MKEIITVYVKDKGGTISASEADIVVKTHKYCKEIFPNVSMGLLKWLVRRAIEKVERG